MEITVLWLRNMVRETLIIYYILSVIKSIELNNVNIQLPIQNAGSWKLLLTEEKNVCKKNVPGAKNFKKNVPYNFIFSKMFLGF